MSMTERKDLRIEGEFLPLDLEDLTALRQRIVVAIEAGEIEEVKPRVADSVANGITGWLVAKASGERDTLSGVTRTKYRRVLSRLEEMDPEGGQRGSATLRQVLGMGAVSMVAAAAAASSRPELLALVPPIIYEPFGYDADELLAVA